MAKINLTTIRMMNFGFGTAMAWVYFLAVISIIGIAIQIQDDLNLIGDTNFVLGREPAAISVRATAHSYSSISSVRRHGVKQVDCRHISVAKVLHNPRAHRGTRFTL